MSGSVLIVHCTCPDESTGVRIAQALVERRLAACVSLTPPIRSIYSWQGVVESAAERLLLVKTTAERYQDLEATILSLHPYELPEILAVPVSTGLPAYLSWVRECTKNS